MTDEQFSKMTVRELEFRGAKYKIVSDERDSSYQHPSWFSFLDEAMVREAKWKPPAGSIVLDVGAAYGSYALTALASGAAFVFAWSPQGPPGEATEADFLERSLKINGWADRARVFRGGCYSRMGWLNASSQAFSLHAPDAPHGDVIEVDRLDDLGLEIASTAEERPVVWMKLDVEGAEVEVLLGAEELIAKFRPTILVENHNFKRATLEQEVRDHLTARGYREVETTPYHAVSHSLYVPA